MQQSPQALTKLKEEIEGGGDVVLNYCTGLTWLMGTKSQKNPFQGCMSGSWAVSRLEARFQVLRA